MEESFAELEKKNNGEDLVNESTSSVLGRLTLRSSE